MLKSTIIIRMSLSGLLTMAFVRVRANTLSCVIIALHNLDQALGEKCVGVENNARVVFEDKLTFSDQVTHNIQQALGRLGGHIGSEVCCRSPPAPSRAITTFKF